MEVSLVFLASLVEDAGAYPLPSEGDPLWLGHKARHVDELLLDPIEGWRDVIGADWRLVLLFYLLQGLVEPVFCRLHEVVRYLDSFVQRLEVWDFRIVGSRSWYVWVLWPFEENLRQRPFFFGYLFEIFLLLDLSLLLLSRTRWIAVSNVTARSGSQAFGDICFPCLLANKRGFAAHHFAFVGIVKFVIPWPWNIRIFFIYF